MEALGPLHPIIVHTPLVLLLWSAVFEAIGLATDSEWWRKAAFTLLVLGTVGAVMGVLSGLEAEEIVEHAQRVDRDAIESHADAGKLTMWLALGALAARLLAAGMRVRAIAGLALLLQLATASYAVVTGLRGGDLVYRHGAGVQVDGAYVAPRPPGER